MKQALVRSRAWDIDVIRRFLPSNYIAFTWGNHVWIEGEDVAGWTMEDYVIPRLASGGIYATQMVDY
jgi:hypothetical protein